MFKAVFFFPLLKTRVDSAEAPRWHPPPTTPRTWATAFLSAALRSASAFPMVLDVVSLLQSYFPLHNSSWSGVNKASVGPILPVPHLRDSGSSSLRDPIKTLD